MKNEKRTRKEIIDYRLKQAGWNVTDHTQVIEEFDIIVDENLVKEASTPYFGHQFSDYVSTYPTMLNVIRDEENSLSPNFFDLIVVDESHRSIYNTYQEVLDYFNTITLGLITFLPTCATFR